MNVKKIAIGAVLATLGSVSFNASATYCQTPPPPGGSGGCDGTGVNFIKIELNKSTDVAKQLDLKLAYNSADKSILFTFRNTGSIASSITDVYFDDVDNGALLGSRNTYNKYGKLTSTQKAVSVYQGSGTSFAMDSVVEDLPSVNDALYGFSTNYSADSVSGDFTSTDYNNGVNQSKNTSTEYVTFKGLLNTGKNLNDVINAINAGTFQIGLNVATYNSKYCNYDFTTYLSENCEPPAAVPIPAAAWLFGSALIGFVTVSNRRRI